MAGKGGAIILKNSLDPARIALDRGLRDLLIEANAAGKSKAVDEVAVDTGNLKNSIRGHMTGPLSSEITTGVEYAEHQEYGTRYQTGKSFMRPAAEAAEQTLAAGVGRLDDLLKAAIQ